jgi:hypothetical protein
MVCCESNVVIIIFITLLGFQAFLEMAKVFIVIILDPYYTVLIIYN